MATPTTASQDPLALNVASGPLFTFLSKMGDWKFTPPSDNLWCVEILLHNEDGVGQHTLAALYSNIMSANRAFTTKFDTKWGVNLPSVVSRETDYIASLTNSNYKQFLAQNVNYTPNSVVISENSSGGMANFTGGFRFGSVVTGRNQSSNLNISFLLSNWDITEIFFDPWIGAVMNQGLIEDSSLPVIKADINVYEYAAGVPSSLGTNNGQMKLRKIISFYKAVPVNRTVNPLTYEPEEAGTFKTSTIQFVFQDYKIKYVL